MLGVCAACRYVVTRWYRAPEILVSDTYGPEVDVWAIGKQDLEARLTTDSLFCHDVHSARHACRDKVHAMSG